MAHSGDSELGANGGKETGSSSRKRAASFHFYKQEGGTKRGGGKKKKKSGGPEPENAQTTVWCLRGCKNRARSGTHRQSKGG